MTHGKLYFSLVLVLVLLVFASWLVFFFHVIGSANRPFVLNEPGARQAAELLEVAFNPPALEDAPEENREAVLLGYKIMTETKTYAGEYVGNDLACTNCHFDGGRSKDTISLVGVAAVYPHYRSRSKFSTDLTLRTMDCFQRSMNGSAPPADSRIMQALTAYYQWISKGIPIYAEVPWIGLPDMDKDYKPNAGAGESVYRNVCARCHGADGHGTPIAPALWGERSYNDGAGMYRVETFAAFSWRFMPKSAPSLTPAQALDVSQYAHGMPRPHFVGAEAAKAKQPAEAK
jgi:thiosulfate dehydrogenase